MAAEPDGFFISEGATINTRINDIAIAPDRRVVFGGDYYNQTANNGISEKLVGRLTSEGVLDDTFSGGLLTDAAVNGSAGGSHVEHVIATADSVVTVATIPRTTGSDYTYFEVTQRDRSGFKVNTFGSFGSMYSSFDASDESSSAYTAVLTTRGLVLAGTSVPFGSSSSLGVARLAYDHIFGDRFQ